MTSICISVYRFFRAHRGAYVAVLVGLFAALAFFASQIHLEEDLNKLMPDATNADGSTKLPFANLRIKDKTFLLFEARTDLPKGTDAATPERLAEVCDAFTDSLLQRDAARGDSARCIEDIFAALSDDLMPDGIDYLTAHIPSYVDTAVYARIDSLLTPSHMKAQMAQNAEDMQSEFGEMFPELLQIDPIGLRTVLADEMAPMLAGGAGSYQTIEGHFFVPDTTVCVAFLTPHFSATNTGQGSELFRTMNELIDAFAATAPDVRISYHGTPASGFYNASQIKHDLAFTVGGSLIVVLLFFMLSFRSWRVLPLLVLPVAFGTLAGLAAMYALKGQFSLLALGIGAIVLGVAMSYVLHVLTHRKYVDDIEQLLRDQVKPVALGCITTVGSFMGLIFINTPLLQDFGLFAAFAITATTLFSLLLLPPMLSAGVGRAETLAFIDRFNAIPFHRSRTLLAAIGVIVALCIGAWIWKGTRFDADMHNLGYEAPLTTHSENLLRDKTFTADKSKYFAASGATPEAALTSFARLSAKLDSLEKLGLVKSYTRTDKVLVPLAEQEARIARWQSFWTPERLQRVRQLIAQTAPEAGIVPEAFEPFFEMATADYEADALYEADIIPYGYLSTLLEKTYDGQYLAFTSVRCENDSVRSATSPYNRICDAVTKDADLMVLDTYYYTTDTLRAMNEDFNVLQWVSMGFVLVVLLISFRFNVRLTLLGFLPILASWLIVLGAMVFAGLSFNLINIIISTFIFGIGVDYSIFIMNGLTESAVDPRRLAFHKTAIFLSAVILIVTVSSMLIATHPAIRTIGFSTLVGLVAAVVLSYVVQPAVFGVISKAKESGTAPEENRKQKEEK